MALTADIVTEQYGNPSTHQPIEAGIGNAVTLYRGSVALLSGGVSVTKGYLKNAATPSSTDSVMGLVAGYGPSCGFPDDAPGVGGTNASSDGAATASVLPGTYLLLAGTGADALTVTNLQTSVYLINETTVGATSGSSTRPVAGLLVQVPSIDASIPTGYVAVQLGTPNTPWGGV